LNRRDWRVLRDLLTGSLFAILLAQPVQAAAPSSQSLFVDLSTVSERLVRAELKLEVDAGPLTLVYPQWIPGEHGPTNPINDLVELEITMGGAPLAWHRDPANLHAFVVNVPKRTTLTVRYALVTAIGGRGAMSPAMATDALAILKWSQVVLYPLGANPALLNVSANLRLPPAWTFATALAPVSERPVVRFAPVSLEKLVDSPVAMGRDSKVVALQAPGAPPHTLVIFADGASSLDLSMSRQLAFGRLVTEAGRLFGSYPYPRYTFLLSLSDHVPHGGLEHHESSDNRIAERSLVEDGLFEVRSGLLPHELVHAWNGKLLRPEGLVVKDFQTPYHTELLWIYEGLTTYLGEILTARSGLRAVEIERDALAVLASQMATRSGRAWRSVEDTATSVPVLNSAVREWRGRRRGLDYYPEAALVWLEVDATIRIATSGKRSLDDFCRTFYGRHADGKPRVIPYGLPDVIAALNAIAASDWAGFFAKRIGSVSPAAPVAGLELSGWRLVYRDVPTAAWKNRELAAKEIDLSHTLGLVLRDDGTVIDVLAGSPAAGAGIAPASRVISVQGKRLNRDRLRDALKGTLRHPDVELIVENQDTFKIHRLKWRGGDRFPVLERLADRPDLLTPILSSSPM
jgi:predicted metalloprotease with PDZ domain